MAHSILRRLMPAAMGISLIASPVMADTFDFTCTDGPMRLHVERSGDVHGSYPQRQGTMHGHVGEDGDIQGVWFQPRSDHPCQEMRGNTYAWGFFSVSNPYGHKTAGHWGYCDEQPRRDWELERN